MVWKENMARANCVRKTSEQRCQFLLQVGNAERPGGEIVSEYACGSPVVLRSEGTLLTVTQCLCLDEQSLSFSWVTCPTSNSYPTPPSSLFIACDLVVKFFLLKANATPPWTASSSLWSLLMTHQQEDRSHLVLFTMRRIWRRVSFALS